MSNVIGFKVFKNTLKRDGGYSPVSGENGYSVIRCVFPADGDWDDIAVVSAGFFVHPKDIASVTEDITVEDEERAALFTIPGALLKQGERLHFGLFATVGGVTIATNTVALDVARGIVSDDIDYDPEEAAGMFEQFSNALNSALLGKADKAAAGSAGELAALNGNGSPIRSGVSVAQSIGEGSNSKVPTTAAVKTALDGKANKAAAGTDGELAALDGNGALKRSGVSVAESVGGGSDYMVPTTNAVRQHVFSMLDEALNGSDDGAPSLFVRQNTQTGKYQLVYEDSNDDLHVLFDFGLLHVPTKTSELTNDSGYIFPVCVGSIDACTQPRTLYYTVFENRHAYVFNTDTADSWMDGKKVYTDIIRVQYVFVDGKIRTRDRMYHDDTASWSEWSTWKVTGTDNYNDLSNKPRIGFNGQTVTLNGILNFNFNDFTGQVLPNGVSISLRENVFKSVLSPTGDILYNFNAIASNLLLTGVYKIRKVDVTNLPQEFTDAGQILYVYHYVTTKTYSNLIRMVTYETADGVKVWSQLVALGGMDASNNVEIMAQTAWTDLTNQVGYALTPQDKADIANIVLQLLPTTQGVLYGNTSN